MALSACVAPEAYESAPVQVETSKGVVTCQLYTKTMTDWDRALDAPKGMTVGEANAVCEDAGRRWLQQ